jgi:hypothetical protein
MILKEYPKLEKRTIPGGWGWGLMEIKYDMSMLLLSLLSYCHGHNCLYKKLCNSVYHEISRQFIRQ